MSARRTLATGTTCSSVFAAWTFTASLSREQEQQITAQVRINTFWTTVLPII